MNAPTYDVSVSVFLPGLMGAGILLSGGILLADGIKRLTPNRGVRRRVAVAKAVHGVVEAAARAAGHSVPAHELFPRRLRARRAYVLMTVALVTASLGVTRLFTDAYADPRGTLHGNPWAIGLAALTGAPLLLGALLSGWLAVLHRRAPEPLLRLVASTWLGRLAPPPDDAAERARTLVPWLRQGVAP